MCRIYNMDKALSKAHMLISKLQKKYGFKYKLNDAQGIFNSLKF